MPISLHEKKTGWRQWTNFKFLCGRSHGAWHPPPIHMRPPEPDLPLRVDVINGWFLNSTITGLGCHQRPRHHHIASILKSLHWLKIQEQIHFKVLSLTYNLLQSSQPPTFVNFSPTWSSCQTLSRPSVTNHLKLSKQTIFITALRIGTICCLRSALFLFFHNHWKLPIIILWLLCLSHSILCHLFKNSYYVSSGPLNYTHLNS